MKYLRWCIARHMAKRNLYYARLRYERSKSHGDLVILRAAQNEYARLDLNR